MTKHLSRLWDWLFPQPETNDLIKAQLIEAQRYALEHLAAAEHHQALADMYSHRVGRLENLLAKE
jgi:hypothetical protein